VTKALQPTAGLAIGWLTEEQSATYQYQQWFQLDIIYLAISCYLHLQ
jgi:hypothetical protein